ncbi:hypothetical protein BDZ45DRAFT_812288 [Acephala macrosclerotiorum]|nr:hypothetical protein BDZ45DRAFT_812288 [Acephala macrosclerotiorum]
MFPYRIGRLVIDGVSNLDEWYNAFFFEESLIDADNVYAGFVEECFKAKDNCLLNSVRDTPFESAASLKSHIDDFLVHLEEEPIPVYLNNSNYGAVTRESIALNAIFPALYKPFSTWPSLAKNLAELLKGNATPAFQTYSDSWVAGIIADETNTFVISNDNLKSGPAAPVHGVKPVQNYTMALPELSKLVTRYQGSDTYERASWRLQTTHKFRPHYHPEFPRIKTAYPILVISTTYDLVYPLISAKKAHNSFEGAGLIEQKSYFYDGKLPKAGTTCEINGEYFPNPSKSSVPGENILSQEDAELLASLQNLASADLTKHQPFPRVPRG